MAQDHPHTHLDYLSSGFGFFLSYTGQSSIYAGIKIPDTAPAYFFSCFANSHQHGSSNPVSTPPLISYT